jgi:pSer/pThr/pTyr-binding forkhead associated (FHA) protein
MDVKEVGEARGGRPPPAEPAEEKHMRDGYTRESPKSSSGETSFAEFIEAWNPSLVILSGKLQGTDFVIQGASTVIGRGPGVDLALDDETLSRQHASIEFAGGGLRLRDLGSLNGVSINGGVVKSGELKHGDRFQLGDLAFQLILEERPHTPKTFYVEDA